MGGFKKSSQPLTGSSGQANMALGNEGQQTLQQGLLGEFERAQSRQVDFRNKGAGLGFAAPSNKKFAIDANARNSVRFDDWELQDSSLKSDHSVIIYSPSHRLQTASVKLQKGQNNQ